MSSYTVAEWIARGDRITAYCGNPWCPRKQRVSAFPMGVELDLSKLDPNLTADQVRARLKCTVCGHKGGTITMSPNAPGMGGPRGRS